MPNRVEILSSEVCQQCERWSDLMPLMSWQLWLARDLVADNPLPSLSHKLFSI
jgi:hypothetical protein